MDAVSLPVAPGWLYLPAALALGALHGLEPGHSKTLIASFLIAVRGTARQAVLLGTSAAASHTAIIWVMAALALHFRDRIDVAHAEPWLQAVSGLFVLGMAFWMGARVRRGHCGHSHGHGHDHSHGHGHHHHDHEEDGDAHDRAHAQQVARALKHDGTVTDGQVILFGLTGGLTPCPSALAVLLLCLQAKRAALGMGLVLAFSLGLALTLVLVGVAAAWGAGKASTRWPKLSAWAERAPWLSVAVLTVLGVVLLAQGLRHLL